MKFVAFVLATLCDAHTNVKKPASRQNNAFPIAGSAPCGGLSDKFSRAIDEIPESGSFRLELNYVAPHTGNHYMRCACNTEQRVEDIPDDEWFFLELEAPNQENKCAYRSAGGQQAREITFKAPGKSCEGVCEWIWDGGAPVSGDSCGKTSSAFRQTSMFRDCMDVKMGNGKTTTTTTTTTTTSTTTTTTPATSASSEATTDLPAGEIPSDTAKGSNTSEQPISLTTVIGIIVFFCVLAALFKLLVTRSSAESPRAPYKKQDANFKSTSTSKLSHCESKKHCKSKFPPRGHYRRRQRQRYL